MLLVQESMYVQNTAVFRGSIMNDSADNAPVRINDTLKVDNMQIFMEIDIQCRY